MSISDTVWLPQRPAWLMYTMKAPAATPQMFPFTDYDQAADGNDTLIRTGRARRCELRRFYHAPPDGLVPLGQTQHFVTPCDAVAAPPAVLAEAFQALDAESCNRYTAPSRSDDASISRIGERVRREGPDPAAFRRRCADPVVPSVHGSYSGTRIVTISPKPGS